MREANGPLLVHVVDDLRMPDVLSCETVWRVSGCEKMYQSRLLS